MLAKELISDVIPALRITDSGMKALSWMEVFRVSHLPIVEEELYIGLLADTDIYDHNIAEESINAHNLSIIKPYVFENQHIYEVIEILSKLKLTTLPVLDVQEHYMGLISQADIVHQFAAMANMQSMGAIIELEMSMNNYTLIEIAQIIESNNAKILSFFMQNIPDSTRIKITLKVNTEDLTSILRTFDRYSYSVTGSYLKTDLSETLSEERFDALLNYLSI